MPPVDRFAGAGLYLADSPGRASHVASALAAELPEIPRRLLVAVRKGVELEDVELAGVQPRECPSEVIDQPAQFALVVTSDAGHQGLVALLSGRSVHARDSIGTPLVCSFQAEAEVGLHSG